MPLKLRILTSSTQAEQWVGWLKHQLEMLKVMRKPGQALKKSYALNQGVMALIFSSDFCDIITIWGGIGGFISHPRSSLHLGGVTGDGKDLTAESGYPFPLVDGDGGSAVIDLTGKATWTGQNYGNMAFAQDDGSYSWRSPTGGYLLNDPNISLPGFTVQFQGYPLYTPLSVNLYQNGAALAPLPGYVRIVFTVKGTLYAVVTTVQGNTELDLLITQDNGKWTTISTKTSDIILGSAVPPVFQNNKVIFQEGEWTLQGAWTSYTKSSGIKIRGGGWDLTENASGIILQPGATSVFSQIDKTTIQNQFSNTSASVPAYILAGAALAISGPVAPVNGSQYAASGGYPPYAYSISGGSISFSGVVSGINSLCGPGSVTVTDFCGQTATIYVRWPSGGSWQDATSTAGIANPWNVVGDSWYYATAILRIMQISFIHYGGGCRSVGATTVGNTFCSPTECASSYPAVTCPSYGAWAYAGSGGDFNVVKWEYDSLITTADPNQADGCRCTYTTSVFTPYIYQVQNWVC